MSYIQGFVIAVPTANKQAFIDHARKADGAFIEHGAVRVIEAWGIDVPEGKQTDFHRAVDLRDGESVVFSWIEWPDKETHDQMEARMEQIMATDDRFDPRQNPMPFDGARMIYGGFTPVVELGA